MENPKFVALTYLPPSPFTVNPKVNKNDIGKSANQLNSSKWF